MCLSRFCALRPFQFLHVHPIIYHLRSSYILFYYFHYISLPPICERIKLFALSNRILRDNVQHPRYEPLRVQILRERR